ncbi:MAG: bactofilin family protein [Methylocystaceae bacterium]
MFKTKNRAFEGEQTVIGNDTHFKGELEANGNIRLDGLVEGHIAISGDLFLGERGKVSGNISAQNVIVSGKVEGDIKTLGRIEIMPTGVVQGDVTCEALIIDEGGILQGCSAMSGAKRNPPAPVVDRSGKKEKAKD